MFAVRTAEKRSVKGLGAIIDLCGGHSLVGLKSPEEVAKQVEASVRKELKVVEEKP